MLFFEKQKDEYILKIKLFFGLFYFKKELKNYNFILRIIGLNFIKQKIKNGYKYTYLFGLPIYIKKTEHILYRENMLLDAAYYVCIKR